MAVIYSYPVKSTPELTDKMLISDGTDNLTKQVTISGVKDTIDVVDSLAATLPIEVSASSGAVTVSSRAYAGAATTGYVPTGGSATTFLRGDGTWVTPTGGAANPAGNSTEVQYNSGGTSFGADELFTYANRTLSLGKVSAAGASHLKVYGGGSDDGKFTLYCSAGTHGVTIDGPDHTGGTPASYTIKLPNSLPSVANQILESNASGTLSWIATPTGSGGVSTFTNTNGTFISAGTENSTATGAVTMGTIDLSATGTPSSTTFLRGDNTWATPTSSGGISFSGSTANGIATYSSASIANVSSNLTIDNTNKKLSIGSTYSIQDLSGAFNIGSLSSTQAQENISFYINGSEKVKIDEDGRLVSSAGSAANPNLKLGAGNDGIYGTTNTVQLITNGTSKISVSDGNTADVQMNDLVEFGYGLRFGATGETLSRYEEGTWTPAPWVYSGTPPTVTSANGTYTIIGDICHITFQIVVTGSSGGNAAMILDGIPTVAQGDATNGEQSAGQLFVNTDSNTYDAIPSMFYVSGDKLTMVVQGGSKNSLTSPFGLKAQDVIPNWYRPSGGSGITLKGSATYKLL